MQRTILCVRVRPEDMPEEAKRQFRARYPEYELEFRSVNPQTPPELLALADDPSVLAVYLQPDPLPSLLIKSGLRPVTALGPQGELVKVTGLVVKTTSLLPPARTFGEEED